MPDVDALRTVSMPGAVYSAISHVSVMRKVLRMTGGLDAIRSILVETVMPAIFSDLSHTSPHYHWAPLFVIKDPA